jgi:phage N-6-adenine-methyltransferase
MTHAAQSMQEEKGSARQLQVSTRRTALMEVHLRSRTDLWATPQRFFDRMHAEFGFDVDVCALPENARCRRNITPEYDGRKQSWSGICWMNPRYGREIGKWVRKAYESSRNGATVVCLLPARTDTHWWHSWVSLVNEVRFIRGRLKFGDSPNSAPFPSAVVVFRPSSFDTGRDHVESA